MIRRGTPTTLFTLCGTSVADRESVRACVCTSLQVNWVMHSSKVMDDPALQARTKLAKINQQSSDSVNLV